MSDHWKYEPDFRFDPLFDAFEKANQQLYFVGGYVRDWQHHKFSTDPAITDPKSTFVVPPFEPKDIDFTTSALPEETIKILKKCKLPVFPIGIKFGTIGTIVDDMKVEITTFRVDEKYDRKTRKPEVRFGKSLQDDLKRRDFTINAMAMSRTGQLIDPFEGFSSLIQGLLMTPIEPKESFSDDPLRILRGFRFCSRFGLNWCGPDWEAAKECLTMLVTVSSERIFEEMSKILMSPHVGDALKQMGELGLFKEVFP